MIRARSLWLLLLLSAVVGAAVALADGGEELLAAILQRPAAERGTVVVPDRFVRQWDPVTLFFATPRGPSGGGPEDAPERLVTVAPRHPGAWTWLDARTLQFRPAEPWPPLTTWSWEVDGKTVDLFTLMSPPQRTVPQDGATGLDPVETLELTFSAPLPAASLAEMVTIELKPLPGIGEGEVRWLGADDFDVKELDRTSGRAPATYALTLHDPIPLGTRARVRFGLSLDEGGSESVSTLTFATAEPFRAVALGCPSQTYPISPAGTTYAADQPLRCLDGTPQIAVAFTVPPAEVGPVEARNLVRFEPKVEDLSFSSQGRMLVVSGDFDRETLYRVTVVPTPLVDGAGRTLEMEGESTVWVWFPRKPSYLRWTRSKGIAELDGPKMVPLEGRGHGRADLRIYRVDPLNRNFWPFPDSPISLDEGNRPPGPGEEPEPWVSTGNISGPQVAARLAALGTPGVSTLVDLPLREEGSAATFGLDVSEHLDRLSGRGTPGHYLVGLRLLDGSTQRTWVRLQVTDLALTTIEHSHDVRFVVTSLSSGAPIAGAEVSVEAAVSHNATTTWETVVSGRTGTDGTLDWEPPGWQPSRTVSVRRIVVQKGDDMLVLDPTRPPEVFHDNHWGRAGDTWLQWAFGPLDGRGEHAVDLVHIFTERPVYRPEEDVHIKGWVRRRFQGTLSSVKGTGTVLIRGPGGVEYRLPVTLSGSGGFYARFSEEEIPTGTWEATYLDARGAALGTVSFRVEAYRLPTFEVDLHSPDVVALDRPFDVRMTASYYAGGRVAARPVRWRVTQYPYTWFPEQREGFLYSSDGRFSRTGRFESTPAVVRESTSDEQGQAVISLDPSIEPNAQPRTYVVEATVTGADDMTVTQTRSVHAVPAFVLGMKVDRFLEDATRIEPEILVAGPDGALISGQEVTVRLIHREWHSYLQASDFSDGQARYITDIVDNPIHETTVVSRAEPVRASLPISEAGVYLVEIEAHDQLGRVQVVTIDLYAGGEEALSWEKPKAGVFELSADREAYEPGQSASILVKSPFQQGQGLVILETPQGNRYQALRVKAGKGTIRVPIEETWVPRIPVHVVLERGRTSAPKPTSASALDLGKPQTVASTLWLKVEPVENTVEVTLEHPERALPGETIPVTIALKDPGGRPLSGEVTLWLVDQAVLALGREQRLDPLPDFIRDRSSYLQVRDTRNLAFGRVPYDEMPGGDGEEEAAEEAESPLEKATVRKDFKPVAYYDPTVRVPASGRVTVQVPLPDNLTVFKVRAKAASGEQRFGVGTGQVAVRLPLIVQPALPRFVRPGDSFEATAIGRVVEGSGGPGQAQIQVEGLALHDPEKRAVTWDDVRAQPVAFAVDVPTPPVDESGELSRESVLVRVGVSRASDGAADAFEVHLPIRDDRRAVTLREIGDLEPGVPWQVAALEEAAREGTVRRSVVVADHPGLVKMAAALDFLRHAPVGSTEQRIARARAYLALGELRTALGMVDAKKELDRAVEDTLQWLPGVVDPHGLVANWPGARGSVSLTAWSVMFLVEAREAGYIVDTGLVSDLTRTLQAALRSDYRYFIDGESWWERTMALEAMASTGRFEGAYFSELTRNARYLDMEGTSEVVLAGARAGEGDSAVTQQMADSISDGVIVRLYQGEETYGGLKEGRTDRNPLILPSEARTLAEMTRALGRVRPTDDRVVFMVNALVQLGKEDGWGNTNTNSAALLALAERLVRSDTARAEVVLEQDGHRESLSVSGEMPVTYQTSTSAGPTKVTLKPGGAEEVVALATTRYVPAEPGSEVEPEAAGFVVARELLKQVGNGPAHRLPLERGGGTATFATGDVVEDHVQVVNPETRHYIVVIVPLAAGMEPLNPRLATAPPEATPDGALTLAPTYAAYLDDQVAFYYETLPKGTYDFYFRTKALTPGTYIQPAAVAEMMYDPSTFGRSAGTRVVVEGAAE